MFTYPNLAKSTEILAQARFQGPLLRALLFPPKIQGPNTPTHNATAAIDFTKPNTLRKVIERGIGQAMGDQASERKEQVGEIRQIRHLKRTASQPEGDWLQDSYCYLSPPGQMQQIQHL